MLQSEAVNGSMSRMLRNTRSREQWASSIATAYQRTVEAYFATGRELIEAKAALPHGEFLAMIAEELPFGKRTAQMLMQVAKDERLSKAQRVSHLPANWGAVYELTKLPDDKLSEAFETGAINPKMQRKDVAVLAGKADAAKPARTKDASEPEHSPASALAAISAVDRCTMDVRATVFEALQEIDAEDRARLFSRLRAELDDLEAKQGAR